LPQSVLGVSLQSASAPPVSSILELAWSLILNPQVSEPSGWRVSSTIGTVSNSDRRFRDDFAALPAIYKRWSPLWSPPADEFAAVRASFSAPASLDAVFGYYRQLRIRPPPFLGKPIDVLATQDESIHQ
jgi:hypothetical protein